MSISRSSQCLLCTFRQAFNTPIPKRRFHASATQLLPRRRSGIAESRLNKDAIKPYTEEEKQVLRERFTDAQIAALEAGENAIPPDDLVNQASTRTDPWSMKYFDDLSKIDSVVDKPIRAPYTNFDHTQRLREEDELDADVVDMMDKLSKDSTLEDYKKLEQQIRLTTGKEEAERDAPSALAPELLEKDEQFDRDGEIRKLQTPKARQGKGKGKGKGKEPEREIAPPLLRLMQMTGYSQYEISSFRVKTIVSRRVANQTRLGKIHKVYYLSVAGNGNGLVGIGEGKAMEPNEARLQSQYQAIRNMRPILRYEKRTIFGDLKGKVGATELELFNRPPGFGLRCSRNIWEIAKCAGLQDLAARVTRARNPMNTVKATIEALQNQKDPEEIARARGRKLVDVRKVYYAGGLPG